MCATKRGQKACQIEQKSSGSKDASRQCKYRAGGGYEGTTLKMPQYETDKDSLIGSTSDYGDNGKADDVDDGEDYQNVSNSCVTTKSRPLEEDSYTVHWQFLQKVKSLQEDQLWPSTDYH